MPAPTKFLGNTVANAAGFGAGAALGGALAPGLQDVTNEAWEHHPSKPIAAGALASAVAQGQIDYDWAVAEAKRTGFNKARFDRLVAAANVGPGVAAAFDLWRRDLITDAGFRRALKRVGLEQEWIDALFKLKHDVLDPAQLAAAIHRGLIPDPGLLRGETPGPNRTVEAYPVYNIDAIDEAEAEGYDRRHLGVLVGLQGLPMGPHEAAQAYFRGNITHDDYIAALNQGNTRNEWAQAILDQSRQIPTARDFIENALRGYMSFDEAVQGAARHGMSRKDAEVIFQNSGRAMNLHQITQALAYGASYNPTPADDPDPYRQSTLVGPLRPEYYELNEALKYTLPSAMYFRTLQTTGVLSQPEARTWYLRLGWPPELAEQVSQAFARQRTTAAKEATVADLLTLYDAGRRTEAQTLTALRELGYDDADAQVKVDLVAARRVAGAKSTALADVHALFKKGAFNPGHPGQTTPLTAQQEANDRVAARTEATARIVAIGVPAWAAGEIVHDWDVAANGAT